MKYLVVIVIILLLVIGIIIYVRGLIQNMSKKLFGTEDLIDGIKQRDLEVSSRPVSVSGATKIYLPLVVKDFPEFNYDEAIERAEHVLKAYLIGIDQNCVELPSYANSDLVTQLQLHLDDLNARAERENYKNIKIHKSSILNYTKAKGVCKIIFQIGVEYFYTRKNAEGSIIKGNEKLRRQTRYNVDLVYIQDRDEAEKYGMELGLNCPNCGASIKTLGVKFCEYCGTGIVQININSWSYGDVEEV